jgi:hypothetical protein
VPRYKKRKSTPATSTTNPAAFENDPTSHRLNHAGETADSFKTDTGRKVRRLNSLLDFLLSRKSIDGHQYTAGQTAYQQWYHGGLSNARAVDLSQERVDGSPSASCDHRLENARKFQKALQALCLPHRRTFLKLICEEMSPHDYGRETYGYNDRAYAIAAAVASLKDTLNSLDDHYNGPRYLSPKPTIRADMMHGARPENRPEMREP